MSRWTSTAERQALALALEQLRACERLGITLSCNGTRLLLHYVARPGHPPLDLLVALKDNRRALLRLLRARDRAVLAVYEVEP